MVNLIHIQLLILFLGHSGEALKGSSVTRRGEKVRSTQIDPVGHLCPREQNTRHSVERRHILEGFGLLSAMLLPSSPAFAGEVGARINAAVTKSDLGISVRRSVVKGAQVMDSLDGKWEAFSDKYGLGAARQKEAGKPAPKKIPELKPLNSKLANKLLEYSDESFLRSVPEVTATDLKQQIKKVSEIVGPSFARSGLDTLDMELGVPQTGKQFNFLSYVHYKAYSDLLITNNVNFKQFNAKFESYIGDRILSEFAMNQKENRTQSSSPEQLRLALEHAIKQISVLGDALVESGLVSLVDPSPIDNELEQDWLNDLSELEWSIALDGDATIGAQILLQEQGLRLYPSYGRCAIQALLKSIPSQNVDVSDYYMDTDYNSDPDKFEVKEVLLNVVLESR